MSDSQPQQPSSGSYRPSGGDDGKAADSAGLLLCGARLVDGRTVDVRLGGGRIEAVGTTGSLTMRRHPGRSRRLSAAPRARGAPRAQRHRPVRGHGRTRVVRRAGHPAAGHRGRVAPARARGDGAARACADRGRAGSRGAGGGAPGAAVAAGARRSVGGGDAPAADRRGGRGRARRAAGRGEDGRVGGGRLPRPRPRSDGIRGSRARTGGGARLRGRSAHRR